MMICSLSLCALMLQPLVSHPQPQMVSFSDRVTKTPLTLSSLNNSQTYQKHLESRKQTLSFQAHIDPKSKNQIQIPTTGEFKLIVAEGFAFRILDNDATDGVASITLPKGTYKTAIKMKKSHEKTAQLEIRDRLYHLKDHLTATQQSPWMDIGLRSLPISKEWHSEDGTAYMLHFKTKQNPSFHIIWKPSTEKIPFPPGIKEIGPEGGTVELPGVAKLDIPPRALDKKILVSLHQERKVAENIYRYDSLKGFVREKEFASPIVRIEPLFLKLKKKGHLFIKFHWPYPEYLKLFPPTTLEHYSTKNLHEEWLYDYMVIYKNKEFTYDNPVEITQFLHHAKVMPLRSPEKLKALKSQKQRQTK